MVPAMAKQVQRDLPRFLVDDAKVYSKVAEKPTTYFGRVDLSSHRYRMVVLFLVVFFGLQGMMP